MVTVADWLPCGCRAFCGCFCDEDGDNEQENA